MTQLKTLDHLFFIRERRIAEVHPHQKAVLLRFGQEERSFLLDGILRGDHHERFLQPVGDVACRDHGFAHRFQQRRLRARRGPVDFIGQQNIAENRPFVERERLLALVKDRDALRAEVTQLRQSLQEIQANHEAELDTVQGQLQETQGEKEQAEEQYQNLLGKVNMIRSQLGERLKADAVCQPCVAK